MYIRGNQSPFSNKTLSKAIMLRTKLKKQIPQKIGPMKNKSLTWTMKSLFLFYERGYIVPATDSFVCCGRIRDLEVFTEFLKFIKVFGLKKHFSKILYLGGSDPFVRTFSKISKMVFTWSISKFSREKLNLLVIYCFFVSSITMND